MIVILTIQIASSQRLLRAGRLLRGRMLSRGLAIRRMSIAPSDNQVTGKSNVFDFSELTKAATQASGNGRTSISSSINSQGTSTQLQATNGGSQASSFEQQLIKKQESQEIKRDKNGNTSINEKKSNEGHKVDASNKSLFKGQGASTGEVSIHGVQADVHGSRGAALSNTFNKQEIQKSSSQNFLKKETPRNNRLYKPQPRPIPAPFPKLIGRPPARFLPKPIGHKSYPPPKFPALKPNQKPNQNKIRCGTKSQTYGRDRQSFAKSDSQNWNQKERNNKNENYKHSNKQENQKPFYTGKTISNKETTIQRVSQNPPVNIRPSTGRAIEVGSYYEE